MKENIRQFYYFSKTVLLFLKRSLLKDRTSVYSEKFIVNKLFNQENYL